MTRDEQLKTQMRTWGIERLKAIVNSGQQGWMRVIAIELLNEVATY